jgi:hypothetical protein
MIAEFNFFKKIALTLQEVKNKTTVLCSFQVVSSKVEQSFLQVVLFRSVVVDPSQQIIHRLWINL